MAAAGAPSRVPVAVACRVLGLSTQGYYKWLKDPVCQRDYDDAHLIDVLYDLHEDDATLGYRFLTDELADEHGITVGENRVHRLCRVAGITASHHKKRGKSGKAGPAPHDDLLAVVDEHGVVRHEFIATAPNQVWLWDISEHPTREGKLYICAIKDVFSNKIVGYSIGSRMKSGLAMAAMRNAIALRSPVGTTCHSDRGGQFRAKKVQRLLKNNGLVGSMGRSYGSYRRQREHGELLQPAAEERSQHPPLGQPRGASPRDRHLDRNQVQPPPTSTSPRQTDTGRV
jgi:putative transposase